MKGELRDALQKELLKKKSGNGVAGVFFWSFAIGVGLVIAAMLVNHFWK